MLREDLPQGFAIHESATNSVTWPAMPCYSNLVIFDQLKRMGRLDTIAPELAERWSWQDNYRNLVFFLRRDVRWHDGQPFTSKDVKFTFDLVREAKDAPTKLRLNPRKEWYCERRGGGGARSLHGGLPAQAPAAVAHCHPRLRLLAGDSRPRAARRAPLALRGHRPLQVQGMEARPVRRPR